MLLKERVGLCSDLCPGRSVCPRPIISSCADSLPWCRRRPPADFVAFRCSVFRSFASFHYGESVEPDDRSGSPRFCSHSGEILEQRRSRRIYAGRPTQYSGACLSLQLPSRLIKRSMEQLFQLRIIGCPCGEGCRCFSGQAMFGETLRPLSGRKVGRTQIKRKATKIVSAVHQGVA